MFCFVELVYLCTDPRPFAGAGAGPDVSTMITLCLWGGREHLLSTSCVPGAVRGDRIGAVPVALGGAKSVSGAVVKASDRPVTW